MWLLGFIFLIYLVVLSLMLFSIVNSTAAPSNAASNQKTFSILIAFRNEEAQLPALLKSLIQIKYPPSKFEIIFINDHAQDASADLIEEQTNKHTFIQLLHLPLHLKGKKAALQYGINRAKHEFIITTDADCVVPSNWLAAYEAQLLQTQADVLLGPVVIIEGKSLLSTFQYYDMLALQAISLGLVNLNTPRLCNGANFCYSKAAFIEVDGFEGHQHQPSGDDVLLLEKFVAASYRIDYVLEDAVVYTLAVDKFSDFIQQRKRWFYKTKRTKSKIQLVLGGLFLSINLSIVVLAILAAFYSKVLSIFIFCFLIKLSIDFLLTFGMAKKLNTPFCVRKFIASNLVYPFAVVLFFGYLTNSKILWKGRKYRT